MTNATEPRSGRLPHLGVLRFAGPDSVSFLQGQVSNDTRRLTEGAPLLAAYSSPQGRVLAVMHLLPHSTGVVAILPRELVYWEERAGFVAPLSLVGPSWRRNVGVTMRSRAGLNPAAQVLIKTLQEVGKEFES